jgi:predicted  nucleic acid-binding Zn-ribbon protein
MSPNEIIYALQSGTAKIAELNELLKADRAELTRLRAEVERLKGMRTAAEAIMTDVAEANEEIAIARAEKAEAELANIANAKPDTWGDMSDSFQAWAQNRARHALAAMKGTP